MPVPLFVSAALGLGGVQAQASHNIETAARAARPRPSPRAGAGTRITAGLIDGREHNNAVKGYKWYGDPTRVGIATKMLRDPDVGQSVDGLIAVLLSGRFKFKPVSEEPIDREISDAAQWAFFEHMPWKRVARAILRGYLSNGFHLTEPLDANHPFPSRFENHPGDGVGIVPTGFRDIPAWTVHRWLQKRRDPSLCDGIEQHVQGSDNEDPRFQIVPSSRFLRFTWDQEGANFEGEPLMRRAYGAWKIKMALQTINALDHERSGMGTPMVVMGEDPSDEDIDAAETSLAEFRANDKGFLMLPHDWKADWFESQGGSKEAAEKAIARCKIEIAFNLAQGFMHLGLSKGMGSYALGGTQQGQFHLQSTVHADFFAETMRFGSDGWSPVRRFVDVNYGRQYDTPILQIENLPTRNWLDVVKTASQAIQSGAIRADTPTENELREAMELGPADRETARAMQLGNQFGSAMLEDTDPDPETPEDLDDEEAA